MCHAAAAAARGALHSTYNETCGSVGLKRDHGWIQTQRFDKCGIHRFLTETASSTNIKLMFLKIVL